MIEHMTYNIGTAMKYAWRAGLKPGADMITDLEKCRWHIDRELTRLRKQQGEL